MARGGHKFNAKRTDCSAGHSHPSAAEARRCGELHLLQRHGEIHRLEMQPKFPVTINGVKVFTYIADFAYFTNEGRIVEDVKGQILPMYRLKKKCVEAYYAGVKIVEIR